MKKRKLLETYVKERFGTDLSGFLKDKVEKELLYDKEIGEILNVEQGYIGKLRSAFGIKRGNGFSRRFERKYGPGAEETFRTMIENPDVSLSDLGRFFGFSREYARQAYEKIYGYAYTEAYKKKLIARAQGRLDTPKIDQRLGLVMQVKERMQSLGLFPNVRTRGRHHMLQTNGYHIAVKCTLKPLSYSGKKYFYIANATGVCADYDFLIALCRSQEDSIHYIIPRHAMPTCGVSLYPEASPDKSKYAQFREAWHLLGHKGTSDNRLSVN